MARVEPARAGNAAAMSEFTIVFGGAAGIAILGSLGNGIYRSMIEIPQAVPAEAAGVIRENLQGAVATAHRRSLVDISDRLILAARHAFTISINVVAAVGCLAFVLASVLIVVLLARRQHDS
jgi:DHA2 family multidrug resistance protein-like MFS transporter